MNEDQAVTEVTKLNVQPGDYVVIKTNGQFPPGGVMRRLVLAMPKDSTVIWLRSNMDISTLNDAELARAGLMRVAQPAVPPIPVEAVLPLKAKRASKKKK